MRDEGEKRTAMLKDDCMDRVSASIIIPTFNRHSTLGRSVQSARVQTVQDIEILIVLDGASPECRNVAKQHAADDRRVRVLDYPKAPGRGHENCHKAVTSARSNKILYCDDDDLLLPNHVQVLGSLLDDADVAETRVASLDRMGGLHLSPCPTGSPRVRQMLADGTCKILFDTHFGHTARAYETFSSWQFNSADSPVPVIEFLSGFARSQDCRWASKDDVTAISLHGAARKDMTAEQRSAEIDAWFGIICSSEEMHDALLKASSVSHFYKLLQADPPRGASFDEYLTARGGYDDVFKDKNAQGLFRLVNKERIAPDDASELAGILIQPLLGAYSFTIMTLLKKVYGPEVAAQIANKAAHAPPDLRAGPLAAFALLQAGRGRWDEATQAISDALEIGPDPKGDLASVKERIAQTGPWKRLLTRVANKMG